MSQFSILSYLDPAIVTNESSTARASRSPAAWPSEASAVRRDPSYFPIYGACMRKSFYRLIGQPRFEDTAAESPWKWIIGRAVEDKLTQLCMVAKTGEDLSSDSMYIANGVKHYVKSLYLSIEMDIVVADPKTRRGYIVECKSYDGYFAEKQIEQELKPKEENLMQISLYLHEAKNGKYLKHMIKESLEERTKLDAMNKEHRNRCEANLDLLDKMDDGKLGAKLVYISRGACARTEFDIDIIQDMDGFHYPTVNGIPHKIFSIESIYERFATLQNYWFRARQEGVDRLAARGLHVPRTMNLLLSRGDVPDGQTTFRELTALEWDAEKYYYQHLEQEVLALPDSFFPPPEYEYSYSADRVQELGKAKIIGKTKFAEWNSGKITKLGDWQCSYCPYLATGCLARQRPDLAYQHYDLSNISEDVSVELVAP